jgi:nucleoside-diphosphate-sugar epimerase
MIGGPYEHIKDRLGEADATLADNTRAKEILGWDPKIDLPEWVYNNKPG